MKRTAAIERETKETKIRLELNLDGRGDYDIVTGIGFFDHMLTLFSVHGLFDIKIEAQGDLDVDFHHTVEDVGLVMGEAFDAALDNRKGICRYGYAVIPMDETLTAVTVDLSKRPYLVFNLPPLADNAGQFTTYLAKEFFRAFSNRGQMNLHLNVLYGENGHHVIESMFKASARALDQAVSFDARRTDIPSTKGLL